MFLKLGQLFTHTVSCYFLFYQSFKRFFVNPFKLMDPMVADLIHSWNSTVETGSDVL